jgi:hypothetical protein
VTIAQHSTFDGAELCVLLDCVDAVYDRGAVSKNSVPGASAGGWVFKALCGRLGLTFHWSDAMIIFWRVLCWLVKLLVVYYFQGHPLVLPQSLCSFHLCLLAWHWSFAQYI